MDTTEGNLKYERHCKKKRGPKMKKWQVAGMAFLLIIISFSIGCIGSDDSEKEDDGNDVDPPSNDLSSEYPLTILDKVVTDGIWSFLPDEPDPGNVFVVLNVRMENKDSESIDFLSKISFQLIVESDSMEYTFDAEWINSISDDDRFDGPDFGDDSASILPGSHKDGWVIFEISDGYASSRNVELRYILNIFMDQFTAVSFSLADSRDLIPFNNEPIADAGEDQTVYIDQEVEFDGTGSTDPDGREIEHDWDFGDGGFGGYGENPTHTYREMGTYTVTLTVSDEGDLTSTDTMIVKVVHFFEIEVIEHEWYVTEEPFDIHEGDYEVRVRVTNVGTETQDLYSTFFELFTTDGNGYDWNGNEEEPPSSLGPGSSGTWTMYFDVQEDKTPIRIVYDECLEAALS